MSDAERASIRAEITRQLQQMADSLKLSPDQKEQARPILMDHANQLRQLRNKYVAMPKTPANRQAMVKEAAAIRSSTDARLAKVLSADQMTTFRRMRDEMRSTLKVRMNAPGKTANH
jgi:hypothetical protein